MFFLILLISFFICHDSNAITLDQAMISAYQKNPTWKAEIAKKAATNEALAQAYAKWMPDVSFNYSGSQTGNTTKTKTENDVDNSGETNNSNNSFEIRARQNIFDGFATTHGISSAEYIISAARAELCNAEQKLLMEVVNAYLSVWEKRELYKIAKKQEERFAQDVKSAKTKLSVGMGTKPEVAAQEAQYAEAVYRTAAASAELAAAEEEFRVVIGVEPDEKIELPEAPGDIPNSLNILIETAKSRNPSIIAARFKELSAMKDVDKTRGGLLPNCHFTMNAKRDILSNDNKDPILNPFNTRRQSSRSIAGLVEVSVPIIANGPGGNVYSSSRKSYQEAKRAAMEASATLLALRKACVENWNKLLAAKAQIEQSKVAVKSAEIAAEGTREAANLGLKSSLDVLYYEGELLKSKQGNVASLKGYVLSIYTIKSITGELTARGLRLKTKRYNPREHEERVRNVPFSLQ